MEILEVISDFQQTGFTKMEQTPQANNQSVATAARTFEENQKLYQEILVTMKNTIQ